jgi:DHA1 family tetracycline resistance protein-like MFS transporter
LLFGVAGFLIAGLSSEGFYFWFSIPFLALWGVANAVINGMMSSEVGPDQQGHLQGAIGALRGIGELLGPGLFSYTFAYFIRPDSFMQIPGSPFFLAAILLFVSVIAFLRRQTA